MHKDGRIEWANLIGTPRYCDAKNHLNAPVMAKLMKLSLYRFKTTQPGVHLNNTFEKLSFTLQKTHCTSITQTTRLMLFGEISAVYVEKSYDTKLHFVSKIQICLTLKQVVHRTTTVLQRANFTHFCFLYKGGHTCARNVKRNQLISPLKEHWRRLRSFGFHTRRTGYNVG
jgi:hypothetical protein